MFLTEIIFEKRHLRWRYDTHVSPCLYKLRTILFISYIYETFKNDHKFILKVGPSILTWSGAPITSVCLSLSQSTRVSCASNLTPPPTPSMSLLWVSWVIQHNYLNFVFNRSICRAPASPHISIVPPYPSPDPTDLPIHPTQNISLFPILQ